MKIQFLMERIMVGLSTAVPVNIFNFKFKISNEYFKSNRQRMTQTEIDVFRSINNNRLQQCIHCIIYEQFSFACCFTFFFIHPMHTNETTLYIRGTFDMHGLNGQINPTECK